MKLCAVETGRERRKSDEIWVTCECYAAMNRRGVIDAKAPLAMAALTGAAALCRAMMRGAPPRTPNLRRRGERTRGGRRRSCVGRDTGWGNIGRRQNGADAIR